MMPLLMLLVLQLGELLAQANLPAPASALLPPQFQQHLHPPQMLLPRQQEGPVQEVQLQCWLGWV
jgi:hypothetical protein